MIANRVTSSHFMTLVSTEIHHMKIKTIIVKNIGHYKIIELLAMVIGRFHRYGQWSQHPCNIFMANCHAY